MKRERFQFQSGFDFLERSGWLRRLLLPHRTLLLLCQHVSPGEIKTINHNVQRREMWVGKFATYLDTIGRSSNKEIMLAV